MRRMSRDLRNRAPQSREDEEAAYDEPFPYYPYAPDHVTIEIGEAFASGAASVGSCYRELCRDIVVMVQIFLWASVVNCETFVQLVAWCFMSLVVGQVLGAMTNLPRKEQVRRGLFPQADAG